MNELAKVAKESNDPSDMAILWEKVHRLIASWANRYYVAGGGVSRLFDVDDLIQAGYLALVKAVKGYDTQLDFAPLLRLHIRTEFAQVAGRRGVRKRVEVYAQSLDEPVPGMDNVALGDTLPDDSLSDLGDIVGVTDAQRIVREAVEALPAPVWRVIVQEQYWQGKTMQGVVDELNAARGDTVEAGQPNRPFDAHTVRYQREKALHWLRRRATLRALVDYDSAYRHKGVKAFHNSQTSTVEAVVLLRERHNDALKRLNCARL